MTSDPQQSAVARLRRSVRAVRSGLRRYPSVLVSSFLEGSRGEHAAGDLDLLAMRSHALGLAWLGHAGVAAHLEGLTLAVDPVLSRRIGMKIGSRIVGPARLQPAPADAASLRGLDLVLLTHAHFDHLDKPTLAQIACSTTLVIVPPGCEGLVPPGFARVVTLAPGRSFRVQDATITAVEPRHWGARTVLDRARGVNSYLVESGARRLLFAGDTAATDIFETLGAVDVAAFGIGAYEPWNHMHATPEEVWDMAVGMGARRLLPIHHSTFELSDEPASEPMERLLKRASRDRVLDVAAGDVVGVLSELVSG